MQRAPKGKPQTTPVIAPPAQPRPLWVKLGLAIGLAVGLYFAVQWQLGVLYLITTGSLLIFFNLGQRERGTLSAYSVFNKNFERLPGTFDNYVPGVKSRSDETPRAAPVVESGDSEADLVKSYYAKSSKMGNKECFCGSGLKFKKCCFGKDQKPVK